MTSKRKVIYILFALAVVCTLTLAAAAPVLAQQGPEVRLTHYNSRGDQPDIAVDSKGNLHIAFSDERGDTRTSFYQTFGTAPNRYTVIQWDTSLYDAPYGPGQFQAILYENGNIDINVADSTGASGSDITGVNQGDGAHGVDIGATPASLTSYQFTWNPATLDYNWAGIAYNWVDASGGNLVGAEEDDSSGVVPIGFAFTFYGTAYDTVYVSSNGYMSFTDTDPTAYTPPASFPSADASAADVIAPLWDDWNPQNNPYASYYQTFGIAPNRYTVIEWDTWYYESCLAGQFQAILYENGNIDVNIMDSTGASGSDITGVNQGDGVHGVDIGATPASSTSYRFTWNAGTSDYDYSAIAYNWVDASGGTPVGASADDSSATVPIGFAFTFYGTAYNTVYVSSNGYMSFTDTDPTEWDNPASFPSADASAADVIAPLWDDWNPARDVYRDIWYTMLDSNGNTLIDDTRIDTAVCPESTRPAIVVDSDDKVHIIWRDQRWDAGSSQEVTYTKLDPYLDDMTGDAASEPAITLVDDTRLTDIGNWYLLNFRMAIDSNDDIHIVWEDYDDSCIYYMKIDDWGNELVAETMVRDVSYIWRASPDVAVDSNDNPHITWNDYDDTDTYETYYMMLDGSDGSTLIDATLISDDDDYYSKGQSIVVDFEDKVHIFWKDQRGDGQAVYYTKIDPSLDDQDTGEADESAITLIDDTAVSTDSGDYWVKRVASAIGCGRYIHICWWEDYDENDHGYLYYMVLDTYGNTEITERTLTTDETVTSSTSWTVPYLDVDAKNMAHITWSDDRDRGYEVYYTSYQGPPCPPSAVPTLSQWGMIGMSILLAGLLIWTVRRRVVRASES